MTVDFHQRLRCLVVKPNEIFSRCLKNWWVGRFCRQCLENLTNPLNKRFARRGDFGGGN